MDRRRNTTPASTVAREHTSSREHAGADIDPTPLSGEARPRGRTEILKSEMTEIISNWDFHETVQGYFEKPGRIQYDTLRQNIPRRVAEYTLNPDVEAAPGKQQTIFVLDGEYFDRNNLIGKTVAEVTQHMVDTFTKKGYNFPDVRFSVTYANQVKNGDTDFNMNGPTYMLLGSRIVLSNGDSGIAGYRIENGELVHRVINLNQEWKRGMWLVMFKQKD